jgi:hypothetical protein
MDLLRRPVEDQRSQWLYNFYLRQPDRRML